MAWWLNKIAVLTAFAGGLALTSSRPVRAEEPLPPDWLSAKVNETGQHCERRAEHRDGKKLLLACGAAGVWELLLDEASPRFVRSYAFAGDVVGFIPEADGRLWVKLLVLEARPFPAAGTQGAVLFPDSAPPAVAATGAPASAYTGAGPVPPVAPAPAPAPSGEMLGRVVRSAPGEVVISLGKANGIFRGDHIELLLESADELAGEDTALSRDRIAVGLVTNVSDHNARVRLGLNEHVAVGALATPTQTAVTSSLSAPPRVHGLWGLELFARPFAALDELGGGALLSGTISYRFKRWHLQALVDPLAVADVQDKNSVTAINAGLIASYDSQYFEMGLGLGAQSVNETSTFLRPGSGLAVHQLLRLGAQDGLNISARTSIALFHSEFQFGGMVASGQIPVTRGYWLLLNGGGGNVGYGFGELGLRVLLTGNGLAGSKFLTVTAGGAGVFKSGECPPFEFCAEGISYGGPMAGLGGEWRF
jgi:hypothetical protein